MIPSNFPPKIPPWSNCRGQGLKTAGPKFYRIHYYTAEFRLWSGFNEYDRYFESIAKAECADYSPAKIGRGCCLQLSTQRELTYPTRQSPSGIWPLGSSPLVRKTVQSLDTLEIYAVMLSFYMLIEQTADTDQKIVVWLAESSEGDALVSMVAVLGQLRAGHALLEFVRCSLCYIDQVRVAFCSANFLANETSRIEYATSRPRHHVAVY